MRAGVLATAFAGASLALPRDAAAQPADENPPLPNVMLLLDTSGSMERMIDGTQPEASSVNACNPGASSNPNRWGTALQTLTGTFQPFYSCIAQPRTTVAGSLATSFVTEYQIANKAPYDANYFLSYHRPLTGPIGATSYTLAQACSLGPAHLPGAQNGSGVGPSALGYASGVTGQYATDYPSDAIVQRYIGTTNTSNACTFNQLSDGALDSGSSLMRFGLMTFDPDTSSTTGVTGAAGSQTVSLAAPPTTPPYAPFAGMWSYYQGWDGTGGSSSPASGNLPGCSVVPFEVGARNPAAPPWEGRMIRFPEPTADPTTDNAVGQGGPSISTINNRVQTTILASRPYGATPITAQMADAFYYFINDPAGPKKSDSYVNNGGCRKQYIILLTDGAPNLDMETNADGTLGGCTASGGSCPYKWPVGTNTPATADAIASTLYNGSAVSGDQVSTYVIGFAVSAFTDQSLPAKCSDAVITSPTPHLDPSKCGSGGVGGDPLFTACCKLEQIAIAGGTQHAYFADTAGDLAKAFSDIFAQISSNQSTRTTPTYSPAISNPNSDPNSPTPQGEVFLSEFTPGIGKPWSGDVTRQRQLCNYDSAQNKFSQSQPNVDVNAGDDFATNINSHQGSIKRTFYAVAPTKNGSAYVATATLRPNASATPSDGFAIGAGGTTYTDGFAPSALGPLSNITANVPPSALGMTGTNTAQCKNNTGTQNLTAAQCEALAFDFAFGIKDTPGLTTATAPPYNVDANGFMPYQPRYCTSGCTTGTPDRSAFGDILHGGSTVAPPPSALLRDEAYQKFSQTYGSRKTMLYAATNDGLLHGFWTDAGAPGAGPANNEVFAFVPPAVMPSLVTNYPSAHNLLLDGSVVTKDVVWQRTNQIGGSLNVSCGTVNGKLQSCDWHTMLVGSYGTQGRGYYALDVTNPDPTFTPPGASGAGAPIFQWQLTSIDFTPTAGHVADIFGAHSGTPAITTIATTATIQSADGSQTGSGLKEVGVAILPGGSDVPPGSAVACNRQQTPSSSGSYLARKQVRCWGSSGKSTDPVVGRSVAVVSIQTGEVLRVFARKADFDTSHPLVQKGLVTDTPLDSPMTGIPIVYPSDVGGIAQKFFIGDADGTVWKFDISDPNPANWTGTLFLDTFNQSVDTSASSWNDGQPVQVAPVAALDRVSSVVLGIATGDTESYSTTTSNYIYSVSDKLIAGSNPPTLGANVNWYKQLTSGERVSGPMAIFDGVFYLSTFQPTSGGGCSLGTPRIYGMDFVTQNTSGSPNSGGLARLNNNGSLVQVIDPTTTNPTLAGKVIPGVTINLTPACANLSQSGYDSYVAGQQHTQASAVTPGSYSLFAAVGGTGNNANGSGFSMPLPPPQQPTFVDSWAAIVE